MKKILSLLLVAAMVVALCACGASEPAAPAATEAPAAAPAAPAAPETPAEPEVDPNAPELSKVRLNWGGSGNILWALAIENGYLADEGIEVEFVQATNNDDMLTLLQTTSGPIMAASKREGLLPLSVWYCFSYFCRWKIYNV